MKTEVVLVCLEALIAESEEQLGAFEEKRSLIKPAWICRERYPF